MRFRFTLAGFVFSCVFLASCALQDRPVDLSVQCHNGTFVGTEEKETGVYVFHGIPFAKQPVGDLRWKVPQEAPASNDVFEAKENGPVALQNLLPSNTYIKEEMLGEKCLHLNVWVADLKRQKKPVFVFIHGGSYGWETAEDPIYTMQYLAQKNPDMVFVSPNYRLNIMGFADLSKVPDGVRHKKKDFPHTAFLGVLDVEMALRWIHRNIASFGGDPNNITICGESAGGGMVSLLATRPTMASIVRRAIAMSGTVQLTYDKKQYDDMDQMGKFLKASGAKNLDDLMALSEERIVRALYDPTEQVSLEGTSGVGNLNGHPLRGTGGVIGTNPFLPWAKKPASGIDLMIGTVSDEWRYWVDEMPGNTLDERMSAYDAFLTDTIEKVRERVSPKNRQRLDRFLREVSAEHDAYDARHPGIWKKTAFQSEFIFRLSSILQAEYHTQASGRGKGKTYMYYFTRPSWKSDWLKAAHGEELDYLFANAVGQREDPLLAERMSQAFMNFARTGDPGFGWKAYETKKRHTMVFGRNGTLFLQTDPLKTERELLMPVWREIQRWQ